jgi:O-antigen/teichoic acid export membrane protein
MLTLGTLASGVLAYAFNAVAARALGPHDYGPIAVLWAALFLVSVVLFRPVEQTMSRGIAERLAHGEDARPVLRSGLRLAAIVSVAAAAVVLACWRPLTGGLFDGHATMTVALAVGIVGYGLSFLVRGLVSGLRWFGGYGSLLLADGGVRLALALPLLAVASPSLAAAAVAAAALGGAAVPFLQRTWAVRRRGEEPLLARLRGGEERPFALGQALGFAAPVGVIAACDQVLVSGGALLVALGGGAHATTAAGTVFAATMLVRAPVFLFQGFAAALLPSLTRFAAMGDERGFRRHVLGAAAILLAFAGALTAAALAYGPESMRLLYGPSFEVGRADLTLLAAGVGAYLAAATFSQAALARSLARRAAAIWVAAAVTFVAVYLLAASGTPLHRVSVAFAAAAVLNAALFVVLVMRRAQPRAEAAARRLARPRPVLIVCSSGGHLLQMHELRGAWGALERVWVTFDKSDARSLLRDERVVHAHGPTNRNVPNLLRNLRLAWRVVRRERPAAILTTGAGVAVPFAWIGRLHRIPTVYVESFTRMHELSLSARMIAPVAHRLYAQWPELAAATDARFAGNLFAD